MFSLCRMFIGTWSADEVKEALALGYILQSIYEVWHFDNISLYDPEMKPGARLVR